MKLVFDTHGNEKQKDVAKLWVNDVTEEIAYGGSKGSGKSYLGCSLIFGSAFLYPETRWFIARKTLNDLVKHTVPSIHEVFAHWGVTEQMYNFNAQNSFFTLSNGSMVYLLDAKDLPSDPQFDRFGSMQMTGGWIEEAGEFSADAKANLSAAVGRWKNDEYNITGKLLLTCNPSKNFLYTYFYKPFKEGVLPKERAFVQALPQDNKMLSKGYLKRLERTLSPEQKERLLKGNWEYDDDPTSMIEYKAIQDMFTNTVDASQDKYFVADIARLGDDLIVCSAWQGLKAYKWWVWSKQRTNITTDKIRDILAQEQIPYSHVMIDDDGVGGGVVDNLSGVNGFVNGSAPIAEIKDHDGKDIKPNFQNLKTQCYYKLADMINDHKVAVTGLEEKHKELLIEDLEQIKTKDADKEGKQKIVGKEDIKEMIGRSTDFSDNLMMRMRFEIKEESGGYTPQFKGSTL